MTAPQALRGVADLAARFDVLLLDQFGLLHDGETPYPGALDALARLRDAGKQVVILSNSGRRADVSCARMSRIGFERGLYDLMISSGEVAFRMMRDNALLPGGSGKRTYFLLSRDQDRSIVAGLDWDLADKPEQAELVVLAGSEGDRYTLDHFRDLLSPAARRSVPLVCCNPDRIMVLPGGSAFGSGQIAELYESLGGAVTYVGKPYPEIYRFALAELGDPAPERVVCVGDSVEHDVGGAKRAGLAAALVRSGIAEGLSDDDLAQLYARYDAVPDYLLPAFAW